MLFFLPKFNTAYSNIWLSFIPERTNIDSGNYRYKMKIYSSEKLNKLIGQAKSNPRLESHLNIRTSNKGDTQRLSIALQPDTYLRSYFHPEPENPVIELTPLKWHWPICYGTGTIVLEFKKGPHIQLDGKGFAEWAPKESHEYCLSFIEKIKKELNVR